MSLATQIVPCGAQNLGGGYTGLDDMWAYRWARAGRTYRVRLRGAVSGNSFGLSYNGSSCNLACDAWHVPPERNYVAPAGATRLVVAGRSDGGNTQFTDFEVQDTGDDEGVATAQVAVGLATGAVPIAAPTPGALLVATVCVYEQGAASGVYAAVGVPAGWLAATAQHGFSNGITVGTQVRTLYRIADGSESAFTPAGGPYASPDTVAVREYVGLAAPVLLGADVDANNGVDQIAGTPPARARLAAFGLAYSNAPTMDASDPGPWLGDYWAPTGVTVRAAVGRDVDPAAYTASLTGLGGGDTWASDVVYFGPALSAGVVPRFW